MYTFINILQNNISVKSKKEDLSFVYFSVILVKEKRWLRTCIIQSVNQIHLKKSCFEGDIQSGFILTYSLGTLVLIIGIQFRT